MDEKKFYLQIFTNEDVSKDPPWAHGQVKAHEPGDALGLACLGHLDTHNQWIASKKLLGWRTKRYT